jgi:hypothetical protein
MNAITTAWTSLVRQALTSLDGAIAGAGDDFINTTRATLHARDATKALRAASDLYAVDVFGTDGGRKLLQSAIRHTTGGIDELRLGHVASGSDRLRSAMFAAEILVP